METRAHAKLSPSASERWLSCPGSIRLCEQLPPPAPSKYADEGTAAHELASFVLALGSHANCVDYIGNEYNGFTVDADMAEHVQVYVDHVREYMMWDNFKIEQKVSMEPFVKGCFGSADFWAYNPKTKALKVCDLKFGKGVVVEPYYNSQLMMYGLGVLIEVMTRLFPDKSFTAVNQVVDKVSLTIVQPRAYNEEGPVRTWETTGVDLMFWARAVLMPGAVATESKEARFESGDHCRFCPALAVCPHQIKTALAITKTNFEEPVLPSPELLTGEEIIKVMKASELFNAWADQVKAFAQYKLEQGESLPGYKLVAKKANRKWIDESEAAPVLEKYLGQDAYKKDLLSIAQAEKVMKSMGLSADAVLSGLYEKPDAGVIIAPETDKRPAVQVAAEMRSGFLEGVDFLE